MKEIRYVTSSGRPRASLWPAADPFRRDNALRFSRELCDYARKRISQTMVQQQQFASQDRQQSNTAALALHSQHFHRTQLNRPVQMRHNHCANESDDEVLVIAETVTDSPDISLRALDAIWLSCKSYKRQISLPLVSALRPYKAWIPVLKLFHMKQLEPEAFFPYLGDDEENTKVAMEVFDVMVDDERETSAGNRNSAEREVSDGEIDHLGRFIPPVGAKQWNAFYSLNSIRLRQVQRDCICNATKTYGKTRDVWHALAEALDMKNIDRLQKVCEVAEKRELFRKDQNQQRAKRSRDSEEIQRAMKVQPDSTEPIKVWFSAASNALEYFCYCCHEFACTLHEGQNVAPIQPIPDLAAESRQMLLEKGSASPCSQRCFLLPRWQQDPIDLDEIKPWTTEQRLVLREAVLMFDRDPCSVAIVVGSRCCREVYKLICEEAENRWIKEGLREARKRRTPVSRLESPSPLRPTRTGSKMRDPFGGFKNGRSKRKKSRAMKTYISAQTEQTLQNYGYVPCDHVGLCNAENRCPCVINDVRCEAMCGCNDGRYVEHKGGIGWMSTITKKGNGKPMCENRNKGCGCKKGRCSAASDCVCIDGEQACNPDFCNECDCNILPSEMSLRDRRCQNCEVIWYRHKQTYIGDSDVHGFGLFAGERFEKGEFIGPYSGLLMSNEDTNVATRLGDALEMVYAFALTESMSIDGDHMGSKARFINEHNEGEVEQANCKAQLMRIRGEAMIALNTTRSVEAGEEFLFNYNKIMD